MCLASLYLLKAYNSSERNIFYNLWAIGVAGARAMDRGKRERLWTSYCEGVRKHSSGMNVRRWPGREVQHAIEGLARKE